MTNATTTKAFQVGQVYTTRSACDYDCIFSFPVVSRSEKSITVEVHGKQKRVKIYTDSDGQEFAFPMGRYSMAPVINA